MCEFEAVANNFTDLIFDQQCLKVFVLRDEQLIVLCTDCQQLLSFSLLPQANHSAFETFFGDWNPACHEEVE